MEILEKVKKIVEKPASKITVKEREFLVGLAADYGVSINPLCKNCYHDAAIEIYTIISKSTNEVQEVDGYALVDGCNLLINGEPVNAATLTKEKAERWIKMGLPLRYFAKLPKDDDNGNDQV